MLSIFKNVGLNIHIYTVFQKTKLLNLGSNFEFRLFFGHSGFIRYGSLATYVSYGRITT